MGLTAPAQMIKWPQIGPLPPARDRGSHVSGLVKCDKAPLTGCIHQSVGWSVTHSFDDYKLGNFIVILMLSYYFTFLSTDPHVAPYWPTRPCLNYERFSPLPNHLWLSCCVSSLVSFKITDSFNFRSGLSVSPLGLRGCASGGFGLHCDIYNCHVIHTLTGAAKTMSALRFCLDFLRFSSFSVSFIVVVLLLGPELGLAQHRDKRYTSLRSGKRKEEWRKNKAGYTATPVACGWAGAVLEKVTRAIGQEL